MLHEELFDPQPLRRSKSTQIDMFALLNTWILIPIITKRERNNTKYELLVTFTAFVNQPDFDRVMVSFYQQ